MTLAVARKSSKSLKRFGLVNGDHLDFRSEASMRTKFLTASENTLPKSGQIDNRLNRKS